jgi:hypothetical protein
MGDDVSDGQACDVRHMDPASLISEPSLRTALDRILKSDTAGLNGFTNAI